jgi:hypothetical protein
MHELRQTTLAVFAPTHPLAQDVNGSSLSSGHAAVNRRLVLGALAATCCCCCCHAILSFCFQVGSIGVAVTAVSICRRARGQATQTSSHLHHNV